MAYVNLLVVLFISLWAVYADAGDSELVGEWINLGSEVSIPGLTFEKNGRLRQTKGPEGDYLRISGQRFQINWYMSSPKKGEKTLVSCQAQFQRISQVEMVITPFSTGKKTICPKGRFKKVEGVMPAEGTRETHEDESEAAR